jgi:hypothetical protein
MFENLKELRKPGNVVLFYAQGGIVMPRRLAWTPCLPCSPDSAQLAQPRPTCRENHTFRRRRTCVTLFQGREPFGGCREALSLELRRKR